MVLRFLLLFCLVWTAGAAAPNAFYPLGIYAVHSTNDFAMIKAAGFNLITGPAEQPYLDAAARAGLRVLASPGADLKASVEKFDKHPALWAWYLMGEPDLREMPPAQVVAEERKLKSFHPTKPSVLDLFQGYEAYDYGNIADITMVDRYPVPWLPLANFGQHMGMARLALGKDKPLIAILQAFDWGAFPEMLPGEKNLRPPTATEMRCMTYEALARGANGLIYFAFDAAWRMREHPDTWNALSNIVQEVNTRLPLFQAEPQWWAKSHDFANPAHRFSQSLESSITSRLLRVRDGNHAIPPGDYILAVNNTTNTITYSVALPALSSGSNAAPVQVIGEGRAIMPRNGRLEDEFPGYAVHIYGALR